MPTLSTDNPVVVLLVSLLILLLGGAGGGFIRGVMADRREKRADDVALLDQVRDLVREEVQHVTGQLRAERKRTAKLERRIDQLTDALRQNGIPIPTWLSADRDEPTNT